MRQLCSAIFALVLSACERVPTSEQIKAAYQDHLRHDANEAALFGGTDDHPGMLISASRKSCESDGNDHFHCVARFAVETAGHRTTLDRSLHLVPGDHGWEVDSVEQVVRD